MADGLNQEIIWPHVPVFTHGYNCHSFTSKVHSRQHYLHSPVPIKSPAKLPPPLKPPHSSSMACPKPRPQSSVGGPGMQAIFLDSSQKSCGTGVFLPRTAGLKPAKKPAFSPVLLPSRVVQALNLNVHELGLQIKPRECKVNTKEGLDRGKYRKKKGSEVTPSKSCINSHNRSSSPEIFLPKEWTY